MNRMPRPTNPHIAVAGVGHIGAMLRLKKSYGLAEISNFNSGAGGNRVWHRWGREGMQAMSSEMKFPALSQRRQQLDRQPAQIL